MEPKRSPESVVREIKRKTRRKFSSEEKIRIVLEGLKGEESISEICRREGINPNLYYRWSKAFVRRSWKRERNVSKGTRSARRQALKWSDSAKKTNSLNSSWPS
jgi:transposase